MIDVIERSLTKRRLLKQGILAVGAAALIFGILAAGSPPAALAADAFQVRLVATPVKNTTPSFITATGNYLPWSGSYKGISKMYMYDLSSGRNVYIDPGPAGSYYRPAAEDDDVVFQGATTGGYDDIYLYDRGTGRREVISLLGLDGDRNDWNPRIQGGRVVWEKDTADPATGSGIYLYDISTREKKMILAGPEYRDPDIWGDYVVCVKNTSSSATGPTPPRSSSTTSTPPRSRSRRGRQEQRAPAHRRGQCGLVQRRRVDRRDGEHLDHHLPGLPLRHRHGPDRHADLPTRAATSTRRSAATWWPGRPGPRRPSRATASPRASTFDISAEHGGDTAREPEVDGTRVAWWGSKGLYYAVPGGEATRFPDVPTGHHYLTAIESVASQGIITGYGDGNFGPNDWLIHQQFAQMIDRHHGLPGRPRMTPTTSPTPPPIVHLTTSSTRTTTWRSPPSRVWWPRTATARSDPSIGNEATRPSCPRCRAAGDKLAQPSDGYTGTLSDDNLIIAEALRIAEFNGLLDNIVGPDGTLASWDPAEPATRAEIAQLLWNLLAKVQPPN